MAEIAQLLRRIMMTGDNFRVDDKKSVMRTETKKKESLCTKKSISLKVTVTK